MEHVSKKATEMTGLLVLRKKVESCLLVPTIAKAEEGVAQREKKL